MRMKRIAPAQLSHELRETSSPDLQRRRWAVALSFAGVAIGAVVGAYQMGLIKRLPDIAPGKLFDAEKVDASDYAYARLQTPDAMLMIVNYGITAALISAGGKERSSGQPLLPIAASSKAAYDLVTCLRLAREEWEQNKALCSWCQGATLLSAGIFALTLPEASRAVPSLGTS